MWCIQLRPRGACRGVEQEMGRAKRGGKKKRERGVNRSGKEKEEKESYGENRGKENREGKGRGEGQKEK